MQYVASVLCSISRNPNLQLMHWLQEELKRADFVAGATLSLSLSPIIPPTMRSAALFF